MSNITEHQCPKCLGKFTCGETYWDSPSTLNPMGWDSTWSNRNTEDTLQVRCEMCKEWMKYSPSFLVDTLIKPQEKTLLVTREVNPQKKKLKIQEHHCPECCSKFVCRKYIGTCTWKERYTQGKEEETKEVMCLMCEKWIPYHPFFETFKKSIDCTRD